MVGPSRTCLERKKARDSVYVSGCNSADPDNVTFLQSKINPTTECEKIQQPMLSLELNLTLCSTFVQIQKKQKNMLSGFAAMIFLKVLPISIQWKIRETLKELKSKRMSALSSRSECPDGLFEAFHWLKMLLQSAHLLTCHICANPRDKWSVC